MTMQYTETFQRALGLLSKEEMLEIYFRKEDIEKGGGVTLAPNNECRRILKFILQWKHEMTDADIEEAREETREAILEQGGYTMVVSKGRTDSIYLIKVEMKLDSDNMYHFEDTLLDVLPDWYCPEYMHEDVVEMLNEADKGTYEILFNYEGYMKSWKEI